MNTHQLKAAVISYPPGTKFSHPYFTPDEYVYFDGRKICTEDGYEVIDEFWQIRKDWADWYIKND